jgi:putative ABC transport system permease protein
MGAIAFGVVALILAGAFVEWILWATREGTIYAGLGHVQVAREGFRDSGIADLDRFRLPSKSALLDALTKDPAARTVAPRLSFSGLVSFGDVTISFVGEGLDPAAEKIFNDAPMMVAGEVLSAAAPREITLGYGLAANLGATVGDTLVMVTSLRGGGVNAVEARVRGLFATVSKAYDDSTIRAPLALANELTRSDGAHSWVVLLKRTEDTSDVVERLSAVHRQAGYEFVPWYELADFYNKTFELLTRQMGVMFAIIGVIIVLTISNSMMMSVLERTSEIGTAMALGTGRATVLLQFMTEGLILGLAGGAIGVASGVMLAAAISAVGIPMPPPPGQARGFTAEMIVTAPLVAKAFFLALVTAVLAAMYPAWKASRTQIVDALRRGC